MLRNVASKVMWVGRATVFSVGLAVIVGLVVGLASTALAANGANFIIGNGLADTAKNIATLPTKLTMQGTNSGPAMQLTQQSTNTGAQGLGVTVPAGKAPITVNSSAGKATNLNADKLDGKDSNAFGVQMLAGTNFTTGICGQPSVWNECAKVTVTVPAGRTYFVSVWSDFTVAGGASNQLVSYCSAMKGPGDTEPKCLGNNAQGNNNVENTLTAWAGGLNPGSASGEFGPLSAGTYTFSTALRPVTFALPGDNGAFAITKVMVRDASVSRPPIN